MGFTYDKIRRAAYVLASDAALLTGRYRALPFPEHWRDSLLALCNAGRGPEAEPYRTVPTYRMDGVLQSLAPDLVVRGRGADRQGSAEDFWLYAPADRPHPLPEPAFERLVTAWVRNLRPGTVPVRQIAEIVAELRADPPRWREVEVDLLGCAHTDGGTAIPAGRQFQLATDHLARRVLDLDPYDTGAGLLRFRAVPRGPRQQGAELMSQPLPHIAKNGGVWWFSVVLAISLHTVPFSVRSRLHLHTGVRRWATHPGGDGQLRMPFRRDTSVYLLPPVPWLPGAPASDRYAVARLTRDRGTKAHGWRENGPAGILRDLALGLPFPDPADLLTTPERWIGEGPGVRAAVVHSTHMGAHEVGAGLMPNQRSQLVEWAEQALPEELVRVPDLRRSRLSSHTPANPRPKLQGEAKKAEEVRAAHARRASLAVAVRAITGETDSGGIPVVEIRLLWQSALMRDTAIAALAGVLALPGDGGRPGPEVFDTATPGSPVILRWDTHELSVRLRCLPLTGGLADSLGIDPAIRRKKEALAEAIAVRRATVAAFLTADGADPDGPALALVEIDRRTDFTTPLHDPKFALRLGCADAGVVTQFTAVPRKAKGYNSEKDVEHRARSGWLDGLRQLGVRVVPEHTLDGLMPAGLRYAAVWMVKRRADGPTRLPRHVPVAVLVSPGRPGSGQAVISGWDPNLGAWVPYPTFLIRLTELAELRDAGVGDGPTPDVKDVEPEEEGTPHRVTHRVRRESMEEQRRKTARYLQRMIRSLRGHPTLLLTHSQNSRSHWPWLQDGQAVADLIRTGHAPAGRLDPDLRLVRVRGAAGRETPQWWGIDNPSGVNGLAAGLWAESVTPVAASERVFYSTTDKAATFRASAVEADKLAPRPLRQGKRKGELTIDTGVPAWNPALMEITVMGCHPEPFEADEGDRPEALALAVHQLRQAPDYLDSLSLPLPLHLAALAQQYVLPTVADEDDASTASSPADDLEGLLGEETASVTDESSDPDPELVAASDFVKAPDLERQLALFG
ncbi:pPIWI_RE module domain-containing protein [Streptosporangium sp. NPDC049376]|uniref:pPIWI_RE module domain-containing protein n=1 Tax=Streptosporangium sp. NPDC049376 TaxID=3366192 RepID=UPI0037B9F7D5